MASSSNILMLKTPHSEVSSSSGIGSSSSSSSYRLGRWGHLSINLQYIIYQFLQTKEQTLMQFNKNWRNGALYTWEILTRNQNRFHWREANSHPRLNYLLTNALIDVIFQMKEKKGKDYERIASSLKEKYQYLMDIAPSFRCYVMMRLAPHLGSKIVRSLKEFYETIIAERTIYNNSENRGATSDPLLYVLMEIERSSSSSHAIPLSSEKLTKLFNLVLRAIDNGVTCASLLMIQKPHVWPLRMLEQMAIASLKKEDYRALESLIQTYSIDNLQRLQKENSDLVLPPVLYRLALQEEDLHKQNIALEVAIKAYGNQVSPKILCGAASIKFDLGYYTKATDLVIQAMRISGNKVPDFVLIKLAIFKFNLHRYAEADLLFMQIIIRDEDNTSPFIWHCSAYAKHRLKQYAKAYEHYMRAIKKHEEKDKNNGAPADVLVDAAYVILDLVKFADQNAPDSKYKLADQFFTEAIEKYRDKAPTHVLINAADIKLQLGKYKEANVLYSRLIEQLENEVTIEILIGAAFAKLMLKEYKAAIRLYTQIIKDLKDETPAVILANMARANLYLKRYKNAVIFYEQAIKKFRNKVPVEILKLAAHAQSKLRELQEADKINSPC